MEILRITMKIGTMRIMNYDDCNEDGPMSRREYNKLASLLARLQASFEILHVTLTSAELLAWQKIGYFTSRQFLLCHKKRQVTISREPSLVA